MCVCVCVWCLQAVTGKPSISSNQWLLFVCVCVCCLQAATGKSSISSNQWLFVCVCVLSSRGDRKAINLIESMVVCVRVCVCCLQGATGRPSISLNPFNQSMPRTSYHRERRQSSQSHHLRQSSFP